MKFSAFPITLSLFGENAPFAYEQNSRSTPAAPLLLMALVVFGCAPVSAQRWQDLGSGTRLQSVAPANGWNAGTVQNGYTQETYAWSSDFPGIINAWSGGAADTKRNRLLIFGGGHVTYKGNNVYAYNLSGTPSVQQLNPPSVEDGTAKTLCTANGTDPADGTPVSRHSYGGLVYIPTTDKLFAFDGANYCGGTQYGMYKTWLFDLTNNTWTDAHATGGSFNPENPGVYVPNYGSDCNFDPNTGTLGSVWCIQGGASWILLYDVALNQWTKVTAYGTFPQGLGLSSIIDPVHKLWIFIGDTYTGDTNAPGVFKMYAVDISANSTYAVRDWSTSVSGCSGLGVDSPGLAFDTSQNKIVGYPGIGNSVYVFDSVALSCTTQTFIGGPTTDSGTSQTGTFGRWQYFPALQSYALATSVTQNAFLLQLTPSTADTTPPTVSVTSPANGAGVGGAVTVSANASDNVAVASVQFKLDGANLGAAVTSTPYSTTWNTSSGTAGTHTLTAVAVDTSGNTATATPVTVTVNASAAEPTISLTAPTSGATVSGAIAISATASSGVGIGSVQFRIDGANLGSPVAAAPYSVPWNTTTVSNGSHTLTAVAVDTAGNSGTAPAVLVNISNVVTTPSTSPIPGLGASTLTCLDKDGDGYGVGPGCLGRDADDTDPHLHSASGVITAYGSINAFLVHLGYQSSGPPATVWCISTTGSDSTGASSTNADTACTTPFATYAHIYGSLTTPYIVIYRGGAYSLPRDIVAVGGTSSSQNYIIGYPGERPILSTTASGGDIISTQEVGYVTVDGFDIVAQPGVIGYNTGTYILHQSGNQTIKTVNNVLTHCEISGGGGSGAADSNVDGDNNIGLQVIENVVHDVYSGGQHNVYLGSNTAASSGIVVSRNILYNVFTGYPNLQFNGRCIGCYFEQNLLYNANGQQMAFLEGVTQSFIRSNVVFNTGVAGNPPRNLTFYNYDSGQCQVTGMPSICPWDQTGNVIENNTFWAGTTGPDNGGTLGGQTVFINNAATTGPCGNGGAPPCGNLGGNAYRNNIIIGPGPGSMYPPVVYAQSTPDYLAIDTWTDNIINSLDGSTNVVGLGPGVSYGYHPYNCASLNSMAASGSGGCSTASPSFVNVNTSFYNAPSSFDFSLQSGSPAIGSGTAVGSPATDIRGVARGNPPAIGAYESETASSVLSPCDLNQDGVINQSDVQIAISQALGQSSCSTAGALTNGQCTVITVQRVVNGSLGGACVVGN